MDTFGVWCLWLALPCCISPFWLKPAVRCSASTYSPIALTPPCEEAACGPYPCSSVLEGPGREGGPGAEQVSLGVLASPPVPVVLTLCHALFADVAHHAGSLRSVPGLAPAAWV